MKTEHCKDMLWHYNYVTESENIICNKNVIYSSNKCIYFFLIFTYSFFYRISEITPEVIPSCSNGKCFIKGTIYWDISYFTHQPFFTSNKETLCEWSDGNYWCMWRKIGFLCFILHQKRPNTIHSCRKTTVRYLMVYCHKLYVEFYLQS